MGVKPYQLVALVKQVARSTDKADRISRTAVAFLEYCISCCRDGDFRKGKVCGVWEQPGTIAAKLGNSTRVLTTSPPTTIAIVSQKGGAGKTTLALALVAAAEAVGDTALVIDTDPRASAYRWVSWRKDAPPAVIDSAPPRLAARIEQPRGQGAGMIIIDTRPIPTVLPARCGIAQVYMWVREQVNMSTHPFVNRRGA